MQLITNSIITATRKATKFLQRDFLELQMLQRSSRGNDDFCAKSYAKVKELLCTDLQKYADLLIFSDDQFSLDTASESVLLVNPIDSVSNFAKSIPFFALSITYLTRVENTLTPTSSVINFPALNEIYYVEKGRGVWVDGSTSSRGRLRVSGASYIDRAIIAVDDLALDSIATKNIRIFGSHCYAMQMFAAGKIDAIYFSSLGDILRAGFDLMVRESGGVVISNDKEKFIATNFELEEKLRHVIAKK